MELPHQILRPLLMFRCYVTKYSGRPLIPCRCGQVTAFLGSHYELRYFVECHLSVARQLFGCSTPLALRPAAIDAGRFAGAAKVGAL